jgi:hypothetical protein
MAVAEPVQSARVSAVSGGTVRWLAAGDSYSSGQGLNDTTEPCAQGDFAAGSLAYPILAYDDLLYGAMPDLAAPTFVACTGATTYNFFDSGDHEHTPEWTSGMGPFNLVTFTFGGDNVEFSKIITQCTGWPFGHVAPSDPHHSCPSDKYVHNLVAQQLTGKYRQFLNQVADSVVVPGGNIVVLGYPELVDLPKFWPAALRHLGVCQGLGTGDAVQLRGDAGDINATIGEDVAAVNAEPASDRNSVHLTFLDVNTGGTAGPVQISPSDQDLFEPSVGGRHNLCGTGTSWMNGLSELHLGTRSFHPSELGNEAEARLLAEVLPHLDWTVPPAPTQPPDDFAPGANFDDYCEIAWPTAPSYTSDSIMMTMSCEHVPESLYLFTDVVYDDPNFQPTPDSGEMHVVGTVAGVVRSDYGYSELEVQATDVTFTNT